MVKKFSILFFVLFFLSGAQNASAVVDCSVSGNIITQADKDFCYNELTQTEAQLADLLNQQKEQQKRTGTLKGDITYLTTQINALKTKIKARSLAIAQLKISITSKVNKIETLSEKIKKEHQSLAQLLRNTNEIDNENMVHLIFSNSSVSDFYSDFYTYASIKQSIKTSVEQINGIKTQTEAEKKDLEKKQNAELASTRKLQVGSGARSEKIRTYNYPQARVTDHRINYTMYQLESFMNGNISDMTEALAAADKADRLKSGAE